MGREKSAIYGGFGTTRPPLFEPVTSQIESRDDTYYPITLESTGSFPGKLYDPKLCQY